MKLLLAIETSWNRPRVILGDGAGQRFDSHSDSTKARPEDLLAQISSSLDGLGAEVRDISAISVNVGPGRLTSVRAGIAFSNALAFSLTIPIHPFNAFEILARQVERICALPTLAAVPASGDQAYVGLIRGGKVESMRFGPLKSVVKTLGTGLGEVAVAGALRPQLLALLHPATVADTRIEWPDCGELFEMGLTARDLAAGVIGQVTPLTEESEIFHEPA